MNIFPTYKTILTSELTAYGKNSRTHSPEQIQQIVNSINEFGFTNPLLIDEANVIIAGHARLAAATAIGLKEVPCIFITHLNDKQKRALIIADNKLAINAGWDDIILREEIKFLQDEGFDIDLTGFSLDEIAGFSLDDPAEGLTDPDAVPEMKQDPVTRLGDIWKMGGHRLMCGDSTMIDDVEKLMNGSKADMVFTDPPYGVNFKQGAFVGDNKKGKDKNFAPILNDDKQGEDLKLFLQECFTNVATVSSVTSIYSWSLPMIQGFSVLRALIDSGWHMQSQIAWNKTPFVIGRADYHWKHEVCWYGYIGENHQWHGGRDKSTVWECPKMQSSDLHPTMKPVQLAEIACQNSTRVGDIVLDIFGGSGSTLIACEKTNRICYMMELSPNYCDVIIRRWQEYTGKDAILESTGKTYEVINGGQTTA